MSVSTLRFEDDDEHVMRAFVRLCWSETLDDRPRDRRNPGRTIEMVASDETVAHVSKRILRNVRLVGKDAQTVDALLANASSFDRNRTPFRANPTPLETRAMTRCVRSGREALHAFATCGYDTLRCNHGIAPALVHCIRRHAPSLSEDVAVYVAGMVRGMVDTLLIAAVASQDDRGRLCRLDVSIESIHDAAMDDESDAQDLLALFL